MPSLDALFDWFLSATARGSLLALAVLLAQAALGRSLPAAWRHALWLPVLFVLGSPVLPESPLSLENRWSAGQAVPVTVAAPPLAPAAGTPRAGEDLPSSPDQPVDWFRIAAGIWGLGALAIFTVGCLAWHRTLAAFRRGAVPLPPALREEIRAAARSRGLRRDPRVLLSRTVPGPAMSGILRPLLLLPASFVDSFDREERRLILCHEFTHVRRADLPLNAIAFVLQALHWCNPLVWLALARFRADRELACDSAVLSAAAEDHRGRYGHALLKLEGAAPTAPRRLGFVGLVGLFGRGRVLRSRLAAIATHRNPHPARTLAGLTLFLALAFVGATRAQKDSPPATGRQIVIQTQFIEVPADAKIEILSQRATLDPQHGTMVFSSDADAVAKLASTPGADVLSAPSVVTRAGEKAIVEIGQEVPDAAGKRRLAGVRFEVLPTLRDGAIHLALHLSEARPAPGSDPVVFRERQIRTEVSVQPDDLLIVSSLDRPEGTATGKRLLLTVRSRLVEEVPAVRERLERIVVPEMILSEVPLSDALDFLRQKTLELDPEKRGVNLVHLPTPGKSDPLITLSVKEIPLTEAIRYLAELSDLEVVYEESAVALRPRGAAPAPAPAPASSVPPEAPKPKGRTEGRASRILLPELEFREAALPEVLEFLQRRSVALDPEGKGLNVILKAPGEPAPEAIRISLSLRQVPLSEVLRYVAALANLKLRFDDDAAVLFRD